VPSWGERRLLSRLREWFYDLIKTWWEEAEIEGFASFILVRKLKFGIEEMEKSFEDTT